MPAKEPTAEEHFASFRTERFEMSGTDGGSYQTWARNEVMRRYTGAVVSGVRYTGERGEHGGLVVEVVFQLPPVDDYEQEDRS